MPAKRRDAYVFQPWEDDSRRGVLPQDNGRIDRLARHADLAGSSQLDPLTPLAGGGYKCDPGSLAPGERHEVGQVQHIPFIHDGLPF